MSLEADHATLSDSLLPEELAELRAGLLQARPAASLQAPASKAQRLSASQASSKPPRAAARSNLTVNASAVFASHHARSRRVLHADHAIPHLSPWRTAPSLTATIGETPSDKRMYHSFAGFGVDGDTQPMDSQIYKETDGSIEVPLDYGLDETMHPSEGGSPARSAQEGNTGHIDLLGDWEAEEAFDKVDTTSSAILDEEEDDDFPETQAAPTSPTKLMPPETPAFAGHKHLYHDNVISSETRTPGSAFSNFLPTPARGEAHGLSLTQIFAGSQAGTSPLDVVRSDPVFERPSPNFVRHSSPIIPTSPTKLTRSDNPRSATEPLDTYVTMKESQEKREQRMQAEAKRQRELRSEMDSDDDGEPTMAERALAHQRLLAKINKTASKITAPRREVKRRGRRKSTGISSEPAHVTPAQSVKRRRQIVEISDDMEGDSEFTEDSMDELATLPSSSVKSTKSLDPASRRPKDVQVPMTSSRPDGSGKEAKHARNGSPDELNGVKAGASAGPASQPSLQAPKYAIAVADSQPENPSQQDSIPQAIRLPEASSLDPNLRITQSQYSQRTRPRTSQLPNNLNTSSVPAPPPISSSQLLPGNDQERVPSSPPVLQDQEVIAAPDGDRRGEVDEDQVHLVVQGEAMANSEPPSPSLRAQSRPGSQVSQKLTVNNEQKAPLIALPNGKVFGSAVPETDPADEPESSAPARDEEQQNDTADGLRPTSVPDEPSLAPSTETGLANGNTASTGVYETANTHLSASPKSTVSKSPTKASQIPQKRVRSLAEIAADSSPEDLLEEIDMDVNIMTAEDEQFHALISDHSSPVNPFKRRKVVKTYSHKAQRSPLKEAVQPPSSPLSAPPTSVLGDDGNGEGTDGVETRNIFLKPVSPIKRVAPVRPAAPPKKGKLKRPTVMMNRDYTAVRRNTRRVSDQHAEVAETPQARHHEVERTAAMVSTEPLQSSGSSPVRPVRRSRRASSPAAAEGDAACDLETTATGDDAADAGPTTDSNIAAVPEGPVQVEEDTTMTDAGPADVERGGADELLVPNRVLARFRGGNGSYYPATCIDISQSEPSKLVIRFDDGTIDKIEGHHIAALDLRVDDVLKVDLPKLRSKTYVVSGFKDRITHAELERQQYPLTTQHGYATMTLTVKTRKSFSRTPQTTGSVSETVDVPTTSIYLTSTMWPRMRGRLYTHPTASVLTSASLNRRDSFLRHSRIQTPNAHNVSTPVSSSRSRRLLGSVTSRNHRASSVASSSLTSQSNNPNQPIFANMAFCISLSGSTSSSASTPTSTRDSIASLILSHGGKVLEPGFEALFTLPPAADPLSPQKGTSGDAEKGGGNTGLELTTHAKGLGFVALITDRYSRRAKYMQALALNLPCLSFRWVLDSLRASRALAWDRYLLPAGESSFLEGAVRSRVLLPYGPEQAQLRAVVEGRRRLLRGRVVLVLGKGKAGERKKQFVFLALAMGARSVVGVKGVDEVVRLFRESGPDAGEDEDGSDWVYVDVERLDEAEACLFGRGDGRKGGGKGDVREGVVGGKRVKVAGDEFVVQSLILGELVEA